MLEKHFWILDTFGLAPQKTELVQFTFALVLYMLMLLMTYNTVIFKNTGQATEF